MACARHRAWSTKTSRSRWSTKPITTCSRPLLYQVATGVLSPGQIAPALRSMFRGRENVRVLLASVREIDLERRRVTAVAKDEMRIPDDTLIVAAGATDTDLGHDDWSAIAPGMKSIDDATRLRSRILRRVRARRAGA